MLGSWNVVGMDRRKWISAFVWCLEIAYRTPSEMLSISTGHGFRDTNGPEGTAKNVLLIECTQEALSLECDHVNSGGSRLPGKMNAIFNTGITQNNMPHHGAQVQIDVERVVKLLIPTRKPTVDIVLLVGESSDDEDSRKMTGHAAPEQSKLYLEVVVPRIARKEAYNVDITRCTITKTNMDHFELWLEPDFERSVLLKVYFCWV